MDIFNLKKVEALEDELDELRRERDKLKRDLDVNTEALRKIQSIQPTIPDDCAPGEYCRGCEFVKYYVFRDGPYLETAHICGKALVCKHFTQKEN